MSLTSIGLDLLPMHHKEYGLSLLELLIVISIVAIVVTIGAPSVVEMQRQYKLKGAVEVSYFALQYARSAAVSASTDTTVQFVEGGNWCVGTSDAGLCDCNVINSCTVNGVEQSIKAADFAQITMQDLNFGANDAAVFDGVRGLAVGNAGSVVLTDGNSEARLVLSNLGRVRICMQQGQLGAYDPC
jgi:prepilin-type N-terminal cleavage/methylation domain-containing protein